MTFRLDSRLPDALRASGLTVVEVPGWLSTAPSFPAKPIGQANHWDAIGPGIDPMRWARMLQHFERFGGAATYNAGIYDTGTVYLWAAGRTVNVGLVDSRKLAELKKGGPVTTSPRPRSGDVYGNSALLGWVIRNSGRSDDPITYEQRRALVLLNAVVCDLYGLEPETVVTHAQLTSRKIDIAPRSLLIDLTASVVSYLRESPGSALRDEGASMETNSTNARWDLERRAIQRMEQLYREHWGPTAVPDRAGYEFWTRRIRASSHLGAEALGRIVFDAIEAGFKKP